MKPNETMKLFNLCRICLTEDKNTKMQPLFEPQNAKCLELLQQIKECGGIELKLHEEFPQQICVECVQKLQISYKFRMMCQTSEQALLEAVIKAEPTNDGVQSAEFINLEEQLCHDESERANAASHLKIVGVGRKQLLALVDVNDEESVDFIAADEVYAPDVLNSDNDSLENKSLPIEVKLEEDKCESTESSVQVESQLHLKKQRGRKKLDPEQKQHNMCDVCGNIYNKRSLLKMHLRRHLAEKPFQCEICQKTFACTSEMRRHLRVHSKEKPFICKFCGRAFGDRSSNIKHERIHTNTKPFSCSTCGKCFTYSNVLKNHMLTHTGEKRFSCVACSKTFSRKHQLEQHYVTLIHQQTVKQLMEKKAQMMAETTITTKIEPKPNDFEEFLKTTDITNVQQQQTTVTNSSSSRANSKSTKSKAAATASKTLNLTENIIATQS